MQPGTTKTRNGFDDVLSSLPQNWDDDQRTRVCNFVLGKHPDSDASRWAHIITWYYVLGYNQQEIAQTFHVDKQQLKNVIEFVKKWGYWKSTPRLKESSKENDDKRAQMEEILNSENALTFHQLRSRLVIAVSTLFLWLQQGNWTFKKRSRIINADIPWNMLVRREVCRQLNNLFKLIPIERGEPDEQGRYKDVLKVFLSFDESGYEPVELGDRVKYISQAGVRIFSVEEQGKAGERVNIILFCTQFEVIHCYFHKFTKQPADWDTREQERYELELIRYNNAKENNKKQKDALKKYLHEQAKQERGDDLKVYNAKLALYNKLVEEQAEIAAVKDKPKQLLLQLQFERRNIKLQRVAGSPRLWKPQEFVKPTKPMTIAERLRTVPRETESIPECLGDDDEKALYEQNRHKRGAFILKQAIFETSVVPTFSPDDEIDSWGTSDALDLGGFDVCLQGTEDNPQSVKKDDEVVEETLSADQLAMLNRQVPIPDHFKPVVLKKPIKPRVWRVGITADIVTNQVQIAIQKTQAKYPNADITLFCDNAKIHTCLAQLVLGIKYIAYSAPYTPELNPPEACFGISKQRIANQLIEYTKNHVWSTWVEEKLNKEWSSIDMLPIFKRVVKLSQFYVVSNGSMNEGNKMMTEEKKKK